MEKSKVGKPKSRFLLIFICIFLSVAVIFGATAAITVAVLNSNAAVRYGGVRINEGTLNYLAATYKRSFMKRLSEAGVNAYDTEVFWNKESEEGGSYGELLSASFKEYLASLLAAGAVYMEYGKYGRAEKAHVKKLASEILTYEAQGDKSVFNGLAEPMGFDYSDFLEAAELIYRANKAEEAVYGVGGASLSSYPEECEKFLATYSHVALIFIREKDILVRDENGNVVYTDGEAEKRPLTADEKSERDNMKERLRTLISNIGDPDAEQITPETFEYYMRRSDGDANMYTSGYYFRESGSATLLFKEEFPEIVAASYEMEIGDYREVAAPAIDGVCFIYKYAPTEGAYYTDNDFLSDFYQDAPAYLFPLLIEGLKDEVVFSEDFDPSFIIGIPRNKRLYVKDWN